MREIIGRDERIRTSDPHTPSVMRYQAALRPDRSAAYRQVLRDAQAGVGEFFVFALPCLARGKMAGAIGSGSR